MSSSSAASTGPPISAPVGEVWRRSTASRSSGQLIDAGETLFYFVMDVGLFRSRDRCATWTPVAMPWKGTVSAVDVVFSRRAMIVSTWRGAFRTSDQRRNVGTRGKDAVAAIHIRCR